MARHRQEECFQRPGSDIWYFYVFDEQGKRSKVSTRTTVKGDADKIRVREQDKQRRAAVYGQEATLTFGEACGFYLAAGKSDRFLAPLHKRWQNTLVSKMKPGIIKQAAMELYPGRGPGTWIRQVVTPTCAVINYCADELELCAGIKVKRWKVPPSLKEAVGRDYIDALMAAAPVPQIAALILFMYTTGFRIGVATAMLMDEHIDLQAATATWGKDKNGLPHRVHLIAEVVARIASLPRDGRNARKVFLYASARSVYGLLKRMAKDAGYKYVPPHQMGRHSFATQLLDAGRSVADVMKLGNWKSSRMVLEIYAHSMADRVDAIEDVFGAKPQPKRKAKQPTVTVKPIGPISDQGNVKPLRHKAS
jgi:hypothetical protein